MAGVAGISGLQAQQKTVKLGITLPLTGADADGALKIRHGFQLAVDEANAKGGVAGYKIETVVYDSGTAIAGQYDPAQAATNTKKLISDPAEVANLGPEMSGEGKAMTPILSEADLATITPSSTNTDIINGDGRAVQAEGQGDLFPHRDHRRLPRLEHGQSLRPKPQGEVGIYSR